MIWTLAVLPVVLFLLGFPIFIVLLAAGVSTLTLHMTTPPTVIQQVVFGGVDKYALLAVPFFIFAGELMSRCGIAERLVAWVRLVFGHIRGSLALTTIGSSTILGAVSGSSPSTVAAIGKTLYPSLLEAGYQRPFSLGLIVSSGSIAIVIPPSIAMILYGASAEQSIPKLFLAGILPGLAIAALMSAYAVWQARRAQAETVAGGAARAGKAEAWRTTLRALGALGMPVVVLAGIYAGVFSPTEAGGVACVYTIVLARYVYRTMTWQDILDASGDAAVLSAQIMIIVAAAALFSWIVTVLQIPQDLVAWIEASRLGALQFLLAINVLLLIFGCFIDPTSAILVLTPILIPIVTDLGIDPIHFGIIMTVNLSIGMFTPPFGLNIFVAQATMDASLKDIYRGLIGVFCVQILALALITYVPELSLALLKLSN